MRIFVICLLALLVLSCSTSSQTPPLNITSLENSSEAMDLYRNPYINTFKRDDAPDGFFNWNDNITIGGVLKSYIPLPGLSLEERKTRLIKALENIKIYENMKFGDGKYVYEETYCVSEDGEKISDNVDGIISGSPEVRNVIFELERLAIIGTIVISANTFLYEDNDSITIDFKSSKKVGVLMFRNLISPEGIRLSMTYTPYEDGFFLVEGKGSLKVNVLEGRVKTTTLNHLLYSFNDVATKKTMDPNYSVERQP